MLEPKDLEKTLRKIRDLSISGASDAAHGELMNLEQQLENVRGTHASFSEEMRKRANSGSSSGDPHNAIQRLLQNF
jgi:hypothetical protein